MSDLPDDFPSFGYSPEWLTAIGALIVQWFVFESTLMDHIHIFLPQPHAVEMRPKHLRLPVSRRLTLYETLAPVFYTGNALRTARQGIAAARKVKDDREWIAHGVGIHEVNGGLEVWRDDDMGTATTRKLKKTFTRERIVAAAQVLEFARLRLVRAYGYVADKLEPRTWPERA